MKTNRISPNNASHATKSQARTKKPRAVPEMKVTCLRECSTEIQVFDEPKFIANFWHENVETDSHFNPDVENLWIFLLNKRYRLVGFQQIAVGTIDTVLVDPGLIFRAAIAKNASAIIMAHNHPSGDPTPSDSDVKTSRDIMRGGQFLKIELLDHLVFGHSKSKIPYVSLRALGHFASPKIMDKDKVKSAQDALSKAIAEFESVKYETCGLFELLLKKFELESSQEGQNCHHEMDGIGMLIASFQDRLKNIFNLVHSGFKEAFPPATT
jgi:DNA repair protein RadC